MKKLKDNLPNNHRHAEFTCPPFWWGSASPRFFPVLILIFLSVFAAWPLLKPGFIPTHDGEYHLIRFWQFNKNIRAGIFFPRWAPDLDKGFGAPLFSYFYPFPNYAAQIFLLLGTNLANALKYSLAVAFVLSGLFFYLWLKEIFGSRWPAFIGALFYLYAPYHFLDLYIRGSVGEIWALTFLPAVLWSLEKWQKSLSNVIPASPEQSRRAKATFDVAKAGIYTNKYLFLSSSFFLALLILSHNLLALLFSLFILTYWFINSAQSTPILQSIVVKIRKFLFSFCLGLGLSSYFWLPALVESNYVKGLEIVNYADHFPALFQLIFPSWGTGFSVPGILDGMSFQIGLDHLFVVFLTIIVLLIKRQGKRETVFFLAWFFLLVFLSLEVSLPVWQTIPFLKYFQYPWRLNSLITVITSFLAGWVVHQLDKKIFIVGLVILVVFLNWRYFHPVIYPPREDAFYLENPDWTQGTATLGNSFNTLWAKEHRPYENKLKIIQGRGEVIENFVKPTVYSYSINAQEEVKLRVNTNYFPGWQVFVDGEKEKINLEKDGAFKFNLPEGKHQVEIKFKDTPLRLLANTVSLVSLILLVGSLAYSSAKVVNSYQAS